MKKDTFSLNQYRGKHIIMIAGKVFSARTGKEASEIFHKVTKKYSGKKPTITYVPAEETLIL